jgi:hypothetical protein
MAPVDELKLSFAILLASGGIVLSGYVGQRRTLYTLSRQILDDDCSNFPLELPNGHGSGGEMAWIVA